MEKKIWDMYALGSDQLPTVGSVGHYLHKCKPCAFVYKKGCTNGTECQFCHLCEPGEKRRRQQGLLEKRRRQQRGRRSQGARYEQERMERGHMQDFEEDAEEGIEEGHAAYLSETKAPRIAAPCGNFSDDAPKLAKDGHAALPLASRAARIAAPGGDSSSKDVEQWFSI
jgi:hypothetical protein